MNPIFLAHLVADFLLQPKWLVTWKEKHIFGVIVHAAIHGLIMLIFLLPFRPEIFVMILIIALIHGTIDSVKISYQKKHKSFEKALILDQLAHLIVLGVAVFIVRFPFHIWWISTAGRGVMFLLVLFSFAFALANLLKLKKFPAKTTRKRLIRAALVIAVFAAFLIPAKLLGASFCSVL